jgi:hypothetical protein
MVSVDHPPTAVANLQFNALPGSFTSRPALTPQFAIPVTSPD